MNKKKLLLILSSLCAVGIVATLVANDQVGGTPSGGPGTTVYQMFRSRWQTYYTAVASSNLAVSSTAVVTASPAVIRSVTITPSATTDSLVMYDAKLTTDVTNTTVALTKEVFISNPQAAAIFTIGSPVTYTFGDGLSVTNGLVFKGTAAGVTTNTSRFMIQWDKTR